MGITSSKLTKQDMLAFQRIPGSSSSLDDQAAPFLDDDKSAGDDTNSRRPYLRPSHLRGWALYLNGSLFALSILVFAASAMLRSQEPSTMACAKHMNAYCKRRPGSESRTLMLTCSTNA